MQGTNRIVGRGEESLLCDRMVDLSYDEEGGIRVKAKTTNGMENTKQNTIGACSFLASSVSVLLGACRDRARRA